MVRRGPAGKVGSTLTATGLQLSGAADEGEDRQSHARCLDTACMLRARCTTQAAALCVRGTGDESASIQEQLREALGKNLMRVMDLFRDWDDDGNGTIDKKEFRRAIAALGYAAPRAEIDGLFDKFDADRSGEIEYGAAPHTQSLMAC